MRRDIERMLRAQRDIAVRKSDDSFSSEESEALLREAAETWQHQSERIRQERGGNSSNAEELRQRIGDIAMERVLQSLELQRQKQAIIAQLKDRLHQLDDPEFVTEKRSEDRTVRFSSRGEFVVQQENEGKEEKMHFADLIADREWGIQHFFDDQSVPRSIQKRYLLESTKRDLHILLDQQLAGLDSSLGAALYNKRPLDKAVTEGKIFSEEGIGRTFRGALAERMVYTLLLRNSYGKESAFHVEASDVIQDAVDKVDIILKRITRAYRRGLQVEAEEDVGNIGLQITTAKKLKEQEGKRKAIRFRLSQGVEEFDDIALLSVSGNVLLEAFVRWQNEGRPSGGPEQFLDLEVQREIFTKALTPMFSEDEIESKWEQAHEQTV